jgi:tetratricopeptide (TPR) repeat protein
MEGSKIETIVEAAQVTSKLKKYQESSDFYSLYFSKITKNDLPNLVRFGIVCMNSKQLVKADSIFNRVIEIKPDYSESYFYKGNINSTFSEPDKAQLAKESYEKFILLVEATPDKFKSKLITAYAYLRYFYIQKEDKANIKLYNDKILVLDAENKEALDIKKALTAPPASKMVKKPAKGSKK